MLKIQLKNGKEINADGNIADMQEFITQINNPSLLSITVGNLPINKNAISYMSQTHIEGVSSNVSIFLMNGTVLETYDESFDALEYSAKINNQQSLFALLGNTVINKYDYMFAIESA